jgi:hypothetical protein
MEDNMIIVYVNITDKATIVVKSGTYDVETTVIGLPETTRKEKENFIKPYVERIAKSWRTTSIVYC